MMHNFFRNPFRKSPETVPNLDEGPWLITGLGNPGTKYEMTWHNAGFMCMDIISQMYGIKINKIKFKGLYGQGIISGEKVVLLKPSTFMNNSGESVREAVTFFKVPESKILIIYDDIDISCGKIRIRPGGSAGTHNGMRSVVTHLNTTDFPRLRIGVGPLPANREIVSYVLSEIPRQARDEMFSSFRNAAKAIGEILSKGLLKTMNTYNMSADSSDNSTGE